MTNTAEEISLKLPKKQLLRNNEYYDIQKMFDDLYTKSRNNENFNNLYDLVVSRENILLAYRNIKKNKGSKTKGNNSKTIIDIGKEDPDRLVKYIRARLKDYKPGKVRRVEIPKANGKTRPLGIPDIEDRLIQQCLKQILEPICEARFFIHSYGFRPNRSTRDAVSRVMDLMQRSHMHYVVDIDIKGFFDNVNHGKLLKQIWTLGIRDKKIISIISKMLKAEIKDIGIPEKGTPQGGILSALLSNIVLNELDWWIAKQWELFPTKHSYSRSDSKYRAQRTTKLKECYMVRYADDFKIFCKDYKTAFIMFEATKKWLKERLGLEISSEKSKVTNLRRNYTEYLGIKLKVRPKGKKRVVESHISDKCMGKIKETIKKNVSMIKKKPGNASVQRYNSAILGMHNYYKMATHINLDFKVIHFSTRELLGNKLRRISSDEGKKSLAYKKFYGKYNYKTYYISGTALYPIAGVKTSPPKNFKQETCNYTEKGRALIHANLKNIDHMTLRYIMNNPVENYSTEFNDNRISLYVGQLGKCAISGLPLKIGEMDVHHIKPKHIGGTDEYKNLIFINSTLHKIIHATNSELISNYLSNFELDKSGLDLLNNLRTKAGNSKI